MCYSDTLGKSYPSNPAVWSIKAGPEFFITTNFSIAALAGYTSYKYQWDTVQAGNLKIAATAYSGQKNRALWGVYFTMQTGSYSSVHFFGASIGYKIL